MGQRACGYGHGIKASIGVLVCGDKDLQTAFVGDEDFQGRLIQGALDDPAILGQDRLVSCDDLGQGLLGLVCSRSLEAAVGRGCVEILGEGCALFEREEFRGKLLRHLAWSQGNLVDFQEGCGRRDGWYDCTLVDKVKKGQSEDGHNDDESEDPRNPVRADWDRGVGHFLFLLEVCFGKTVYTVYTIYIVYIAYL